MPSIMNLPHKLRLFKIVDVSLLSDQDAQYFLLQNTINAIRFHVTAGQE